VAPSKTDDDVDAAAAAAAAAAARAAAGGGSEEGGGILRSLARLFGLGVDEALGSDRPEPEQERHADEGDEDEDMMMHDGAWSHDWHEDEKEL